ncbi:S9 family peptidase [Candidatus Poriferisodalis sp.]|uniref:S9 family peptidase n=1 Tax=Candidatus Poriferisodalis sp. TaxID=3101277 RepID=UPI003B01B39E
MSSDSRETAVSSGSSGGDSEGTPYGAWPSPLHAADVAAGAVRRSEARIVGDWAYWVEERPGDRGRGAVVRVPLDNPQAVPNDVPHTAEADIRTAAHEYGGGAWLPFAAADGRHFVLGSCMTDHRVRLFDVTGGDAPRVVTPSPESSVDLRYADPVLLPTAPGGAAADVVERVTFWVRETHEAAAREPRNELVAVRLDGEVSVVASGADFYSSPRPSPDGTRLAYLSWDHPNMPWDHTRLHLVDLRDGAPVAGSDRVLCDSAALTQPAWSQDNALHVVTDVGGWWSIHRVDTDAGTTEPVLNDASAAPASGREFGLPAWVFAQSTYGWDQDGTLWCTWMSGGIGHLGTARDGRLEEIPSGFTDFGRLATTDRGSVVTVAASWTRRAAVVEIVSDGSHRRLSADESAVLAPADTSAPEAISFRNEGGREAHAFYFPPANSAVADQSQSPPPLVVLSHGGPTGAARSSLDLGIQYWTTRGIAVVDVNYGGSTGYGTAYRNLLRGQWGVVDTQDCIAAALHLAATGRANRRRLVIKGGSAGGYTTLCALTGSDVFAAGISRYGVADLEALARDTHKFEARYLDGLIGPWPQQADLYRERSPLGRVDRLRTPMIVLAGTEDRVVPQSQSERVVAALAEAGVPHAYVLFEGEGHGFRRGPNIVAALEAELSFLGQMLNFEPAGDIARVEVRAASP